MSEKPNTVGATKMLPPFNLFKWIEEHKHLLKPPVNAQLLFEESQFVIMIVGGPNQRSDYHINETEEFFYQITGDMVLKTVWDGKFVDIDIKEGEVFLLPGNTPHSPQRFANTVGLVIEKRRNPENIDKCRWYCDNENCRAMLYEESFHVDFNLGAALKPVMQRFYEDEKLRTCAKCGTIHVARYKEEKK